MRLIYPDEMPEPLQGLVCRQSRLATLLFTVLSLAMGLGLPAFLLWKARVWWWVALFALALAAMLTKFLLGNLWRTMRHTNWILRVSPDCLWINIRSYANCDFARTRTVIQLPYEEIASVGELAVQRAEHNREGNVTWTDRSLEVRLREIVPSEVSSEIAEERRRHVESKALGGLVTISGRSCEQSVTVPDADLIRVAWRGKSDWVTPSLHRVLDRLQGRVLIAEATSRDDSKLDQMTDAELERLVLRSLESGDKLGAMKLLQLRGSYTTTEAHEFIEALAARI